ncbi:MAG: hypothetical protein ABII93_06655 [Chrysiogenia bacterium]
MFLAQQGLRPIEEKGILVRLNANGNSLKEKYQEMKNCQVVLVTV